MAFGSFLKHTYFSEVGGLFCQCSQTVSEYGFFENIAIEVNLGFTEVEPGLTHSGQIYFATLIEGAGVFVV